MKPLALSFITLLTTLFLTCTASAQTTGVWTGSIYKDQLQLNISLSGSRGGDERPWQNFTNNVGFSIPMAEVEGFDPSAPNVAFSLRAPAGTIAFDGTFRENLGAGHFTFTSNEAFIREMKDLGYTDYKTDDLAMFTVNRFAPGTIRELRALGYEISRRDVTEVAVFKITPAVIREYAALGYDKLTLKELVNFRVGRVDRAYVEGMRTLGYKDLSAREIADMAILGVTPAYVRDLRQAGLTGLSAREVRDLHIGQIDAKKIAGYRAAGYGSLTPRQLGEFGMQQITPEYIASLRAAGYDTLTPSELENLRAMNITPEFIKQMNAAGVKDLRKMVELKATGAAEILLKKKR